MRSDYQFVCFGEVLWDLFPDYQAIGGAPLNVALRLNTFNGNTAIISAVGEDDLGQRLLDYLKENHLTSKFVEISNKYDTGSVKVILDKNGSASYDIEFPKAWDHISFNSENEKLVRTSDVFIFGSLAARNGTSYQTLKKLLHSANLKVFDVNLRKPHYSFDVLEELMLEADFVKMNDEELDLFCDARKIKKPSMEEQILELSELYNLSQICVTRGKYGAILLHNGSFYEHPGYSVVVKDTVGAGDSFLASLIAQLHSGSNPQEALRYACAMGSRVASKQGANASVSEREINELISS